MNVTVQIPDDVAQRLAADGTDIERRTLEAFAAEEYRAERLTLVEVRQMLGFETRIALDAFLKERGLYDTYDIEDFERDRADLDSLGL